MKICSYHLPTVDSTNSWAKRHLQDFDEGALTIISSDTQTKGRGRWERSWVSPTEKNIYASLILQVDEKKVPVFCLSQLTVITIQEVLKKFGIDAKIKWPNDLLV